MFSLQHKKRSFQVLNCFFSFLRKYEERKAHDMLSLMLDPRLKTFHLLSSLIGREQGKAIVEKYDQKSLFPMLMKCYYHLPPLVEFKRGVVDEKVEEDKSLNIFEMAKEPKMKLVNRKLLIFSHYKVNVKNIKCPLQWWEKHESMFPTFVLCVRQVLGIIGFRIEIKRIF
jgi:hypothetical protein